VHGVYEFIKPLFTSDVELLVLMWCVGNAITDPVDTSNFVILNGGGGNGKSTVTKCVESALRGCTSPLPPGTLNKHTMSEDALIAVCGNRVVTESDVNLSWKFPNVSVVRSIQAKT